MITEFLVASLCVSFMVGALVGKLFVRQATPQEPTCTGYRAFVRLADGKWSTEYFSKDDCAALRSPTCMDGRCTLHCRESCRCESLPVWHKEK